MRGFEIEVIGTDPDVDRRLSAVAEIDVPLYPGLRIGVPSLPAAVETLAEGAFDAIHVCSPGPAGIAGALVARGLGLPLIGSYHTELTAYAGLRSGEPRLAEAMDARRARALRRVRPRALPQPRLRRGAGSSSGSPASRIARWDRGVDSSRFDPALRGERPLPGELNVLYTGRITREKGADLLADAFLDARERDPRLHLVLAGGGPEQERLRERLGEHATFLGWLEGAELARAYASADIFLFPSATDTFGQVILEAQASGLPVVAVAAGGPLSLIEHRVSGLLCEPAPTRSPRACSSWPARRCCAGGSRGGGARGRAPAHLGAVRSSASPRATAACSTERLAARPAARRRAVPPERTIAVALHDIEPATFERCALIRDWLDDHGVDRVTLLVIPARDLHPLGERSPEMIDWLADRRRARRLDRPARLPARAAAPPSLVATASRPQRAASRAAEFVGLDDEETRRAVDAGWRVLKLAGIEPDGFVAPAYAYTPALRRAASARFRWWAPAEPARRRRGACRGPVDRPPASRLLAHPTGRRLLPAWGPRSIRAGALLAGDTLRLDLSPGRPRAPPPDAGAGADARARRPPPAGRHLRRTGGGAAPGREHRGFQRAEAPRRGVAERREPEQVLDRAQQREVVEGFLVEVAGLTKGESSSAPTWPPPLGGRLIAGVLAAGVVATGVVVAGSGLGMWLLSRCGRGRCPAAGVVALEVGVAWWRVVVPRRLCPPAGSVTAGRGSAAACSRSWSRRTPRWWAPDRW